MKSTSTRDLAKGYVIKTYLFDGFCLGYLFVLAIVGFLNPSEEQRMNMGLIAATTLSAFSAGAVISIMLNVLGYKTLGELIFEPPHRKPQVPEKWTGTVWGWQLAITLLVTLGVGFEITKFSFTELFDEAGFSGAVRLFQGLATPNLDILPNALWTIVETVYIAFIATTIAIPVAFVLSFFCAKNLMGKSGFGLGVYFFLRALLNLIRSIEALIWAIIASVWVGIGPFAGMLALMVHSVASLAKQYSEIVESIQEGPVEGVESTGANRFQTVWFAVVPQIVLPYISFTIYRWDINVRMATIIGLVGGGGIGTMLIQYQGQAMWHEVGTIIIVIAAVVWLMDTFSAYIREAIK